MQLLKFTFDKSLVKIDEKFLSLIKKKELRLLNSLIIDYKK